MDKQRNKPEETGSPVIYQTITDCHVFNGPVSGCVFNLPGGTVNYTVAPQQSGAGQESRTASQPMLRPGFFSTRIFNTSERLMRLRDTIASAIDMGDGAKAYGKQQAERINPLVQSEWYYILKAVSEAGVADGRVGDREFVELMAEWFPQLFAGEAMEDWDDYKCRLCRSISAERRLWRIGSSRQEVPLKDTWTKGIGKRIGEAKASRVCNIALLGLRASLVALKEELEL